ncbi:rhomboid family intramembrane serine protease [Corynebacterium terpenotabidum]|uniref:Peptidase S54 rhomboid domain-containing protein n=1 Tax=Corynebacterium terpenotabidum Y-11 TaxID=1200352 RepID=S4XB72_9CORY|nr:rhomboid family intramembrane serine protease [Corynebacterium terpenotabidum]AGP29714.1 hypothetical protein A606_00280 [Corynebacterium terpenotabidum Y-11]
MDFLRRFTRDAPACAVLIIACVAVFCVAVLQTGSLTDPVGLYGSGSDLAWDLMMIEPDITVGHEWWRLVTSALVHLSLTHLLLNLLLIVLLGGELERAYGTKVLASAMVFCAVTGSLGAMWFAPEHAMGGASTIGYGMFAMLVGLSLTRGTDVRGPLVLIGVNLAFTVTTGGVSLAGHLGGLAGGALVALVLWWRYRRGATSSPWSSAGPR